MPPKIPACIDLQVEIVPVPFAKLSEQKDGEGSAVIRARVVAALLGQGTAVKKLKPNLSENWKKVSTFVLNYEKNA